MNAAFDQNLLFNKLDIDIEAQSILPERLIIFQAVPCKRLDMLNSDMK